MKGKIAIALTIFLFFSPGAPACTSFAVYFAEIWYGMNFDYPDTPIRFAVIGEAGKRQFKAFFGRDGYIAGMNEGGLFTNYQILTYNRGLPDFKDSASSLALGDLNAYSLANLSSVKAVKEYIGKRTLVPSWGLSLHSLFADPGGGAIVVEPFGAFNGITEAKGGFLVMANFPNSDFRDSDYRSVQGVGASRYTTAYGYIEAHKADFRYGDAIEVLKRTAQSSGDYPTQISLAFDPKKGEIYFCLKRDFSKIWKVSIRDGAIRRHSGLMGDAPRKIGPAGIWAHELAEK